MQTDKSPELVYGIYFAQDCGKFDAFNGPDTSKRQAGIVLSDSTADSEIIAQLVASDFLNQHQEYRVSRVNESICILISYASGTPYLILMFETPFEAL